MHCNEIVNGICYKSSATVDVAEGKYNNISKQLSDEGTPMNKLDLSAKF